MKVISQINNYCKTIMGEQKINDALCYRLLTYCRLIDYDGLILLYNNLTKELLELSKVEVEIALYQQKNNSIREYLIKNWFLVPDGNDDCKLKNQLESVAKLLNMKKCINTFVIFTTTDCNARCFYCYESGIQKYNMTEDTAYKTAKFIITNCKGHPVNLTWFGGEPLYNYNVIDIICSELKNNGIKYCSKMKSNGYLFDNDLVDKSIDLWNLKRVQITLDGTEDVYNRCKNFIHKDGISPYKRVLNNIECLADRKIKVKIRLNIGKHNLQNIYDLVSELHTKFGGNEYVKIYASALFEDNGAMLNDFDYQNVMNNLFRIEDYIESLGMFYLSRISKNVQTSYCFADNDAAMGILPDGKLTKCEHIIDKDFVGDIFSNAIDKKICNSWKERVLPIELCNSCAYFPTCMTLKKCTPSTARPCNQLEQKRLLRLLDKKIIALYKKEISK